MIGRRQLVLDDDGVTCLQVGAEEIECETTHAVFGGRELKIHAQHVGEDIAVEQQPLGEVMSFVGPHLPHRDGGDAAQLGQVDHRVSVGSERRVLRLNHEAPITARHLVRA